MSVKKLSVNTLVYAIGPQIPKIVSIIMLPIITPYLSPRDYGIYGTLMAYTTALIALKELGLTTVLSTSFYKYENRFRFIWNKLYTITTVWSVPLAFIIALITYIVLPEEELKNYWWIVFFSCSPIVFFEPTKWIGRKYFQLIQKPLPIVLFNGIAAIIGIIANYVTMNIFRLGYLGWFIAGFVISLVSFIPYLWVLIKKVRIQFDFNITRKWLYRYLAIGLPVLPHYYSTYLLDASDRLILDWYGIPLDDIGLYSLAYSLGAYFGIISNALAEASGPMYIKLFKTETLADEKKARNLTSVMQCFTVILAFLVCVWVKEGFSLLIKNDALQSSYAITIIIIMSYAYKPISFGPITKLQYLYKTKELWKISFMAGIVNVILNLILIPLIGIWGSVLATFMALMFSGFRGYTLKEFKENNPVNYYPVFWLFTICIITLIAFFIKDIYFLYKLIITLVLLSVTAVLFIKKRTQLSF